MNHLNSAMKYGFWLLESTISINGVDENGLQNNLNNSKWKHVSEIGTPGGAFPQGKEVIKNRTSISTYFDNPHRFQCLKNVQEYNNFFCLPLVCAQHACQVFKISWHSLFYFTGHSSASMMKQKILKRTRNL